MTRFPLVAVQSVASGGVRGGEGERERERLSFAICRGVELCSVWGAVELCSMEWKVVVGGVCRLDWQGREEGEAVGGGGGIAGGRARKRARARLRSLLPGLFCRRGGWRLPQRESPPLSSSRLFRYLRRGGMGQVRG